MLEVVVFALVLVLAQLVAGLGIMTLCLSNWFMRKSMQKSIQVMSMMAEEMENEDSL